MKYILKIIILQFTLICSVPAQAADFFSHTVVNMPYSYQTNGGWVRIISSQQEWETFYQELTAPYVEFLSKVEPMPIIDFENYMLIAGGLGFKSSNGTTVSIESVIELYNIIYVNAVSTRTGVNCMAGAQVTYPTVAILIKKTAKKIKIYLSEAIINCE